jgi:hypothetical protein
MACALRGFDETKTPAVASDLGPVDGTLEVADVDAADPCVQGVLQRASLRSAPANRERPFSTRLMALSTACYPAMGTPKAHAILVLIPLNLLPWSAKELK